MTAGVVAGTPAADYLALYLRLLDPAAKVLRVPADLCPPFWERLADNRSLRVETVPPVRRTFPEPTGRLAFWRSTGIASAYTWTRVVHLEPEVLSYEDVMLRTGLHPGPGPGPLVLAALSAHLGMSCSYVGIAASPATVADRGALDGPAFVSLWNEFHPGHRLRTVCADLTRDRLLAALPAGSERDLSSCDRRAEGWCGDCSSCFTAFYTAKAVGRPLGFRLSGAIFDDLYTRRYRRYLASEFQDGDSDTLRCLAHLQMTYGLRFDRTLDVSSDARTARPTQPQQERI